MNWVILLIGIIIGGVLMALFEYGYRREQQTKLYRAEYESRITALNSQVAALQAQVGTSSTTLSSQTEEIEGLKAELTAKTEALEECSSLREKAESEVEYLRGLLEEADAKLATLEGKGSDLNADGGVDIEVETPVETAALVETPDSSISIDKPRFKWFDWDFDFSGWGEGDDVELSGQGLPGGSVDVSYANSLLGKAEVDDGGRWAFPFKVPSDFSFDFLNFTGRNSAGIEVDDIEIDLALSSLPPLPEIDEVTLDALAVETPTVEVDLDEASIDVDAAVEVDTPEIEADSFTPITPELAAKLGIPETSDEDRRLFDWGKFNFLDWKFGDERTLDGEGDAGGSVDVSYRGNLVGTAPVEESGRWEQSFDVPAGFLPGFLGIFGRNEAGEATSSTIGIQAEELGITANNVRDEKVSTGDDFSRLWGIGPVIQGLLHGRGVTTYGKLADVSEEDVKAVIKESKVSKSRLPENPHLVWTSQARLANSGDWDGVAAFIDTNRRDDLKLIWGIGPKIEGLLNNKGIYTFAKLSRMLPEDINAIINEAGTRFVLSPDRLHSSWIEQAHVADIEDWDEFNRIKDSLSWKNIN